MTKYDFIAIGGGNAGLTALGKIAAAGYKTALIDRGPVGGLCSLNGCNPKKVLVRSTEALQEIRDAVKFGIEVSEPKIDWSRVIDRKESFTKPVTPGTEDWLKQTGIDYIKGSPSFVDKQTLAVNGDYFQAESVLIATGSTPQPLKFTGAELTKTSDDLLAERSIPERLVIIGAGVIAFEMGQIFARVGSKVTILAHGTEALAGNDQDLVRALIEFSKKLGIEVLFESETKSIRVNGGAMRLSIDVRAASREIEADFALNAAGRVPSIADLQLQNAAVETDRRGVKVNDFLRSTSNPQVWAAGDAHGRLQLSPIASYEGRVMARNFLERDVERVDYESIPRCIYTIPPLASVGITEAQARERKLRITVHSNDMSGWKIYGILGEELARAKIILDADTGKILGAHLLAATAGEQINLFALAMRTGTTAKDLQSMVYAYPTFSSALPYTLG